MASSLGAAFGVAISATLFTAMSGQRMHWLEGMIAFHGRRDNLALREAALLALAFNVMMVVVAIVSIILTVPGDRKQSD